MCRNNQIGLDKFCYCCGGVTNYHIYGSICNRYCLKFFNRESVSFSKPCRLTDAKQKEIKQQNDKRLNPHDEDGNFNYDEPFPPTPQKMPIDFIECESSDGGPRTYANFAQANALDQDKKDSGICQYNINVYNVMYNVIHTRANEMFTLFTY